MSATHFTDRKRRANGRLNHDIVSDMMPKLSNADDMPNGFRQRGPDTFVVNFYRGTIAEQSHMARAAFDLVIRRLAELLAFGVDAVKRFVSGGIARNPCIVRLCKAVETEGLEFLAENGCRRGFKRTEGA